MFIHGVFEKGLERGIEYVYTHKANFKAFLSLSTVNRNAKLRVSFSSILKLKLNNDFLLIENQRRANRFGPIGGVIRYFPPAKELILDELKFEDQLLSKDGPADLRGFTRGKYFHKLMKWFQTGKHIERLTLAREIEEELAEIGLPHVSEQMPRLEFDLIRIIHEGPIKVLGEDYLQYRLFQVYQLEASDPASQEFSLRLIKAAKQSDKLLFASRSEIEKGKTKTGKLIGDHSGYLFGKERVGVEPPPFQ